MTTIAEALAAKGYTHRPSHVYGRREVIHVATGQSVGHFYAHEALAAVDAWEEQFPSCELCGGIIAGAEPGTAWEYDEEGGWTVVHAACFAETLPYVPTEAELAAREELLR